MASNKNVFYATNPARMADALGTLLDASGINLQDMLIFLPSRRAVRGIEKYLVNRAGHAIILPKLVALGEGTDDDNDFESDEKNADAIPDVLRIAVMARLLAADASVGNLATALPLAKDLIRMQNYLENEGVDAAGIKWNELIDEKFAVHFRRKAEILGILSKIQKEISDERPTLTQVRNADIRGWIKHLDKYKLVMVCASTASVPATADLMEAIANLPHGRIILSGHISGNVDDFKLDTNPYNSEYKFLSRLGINQKDLIPIDVGSSAIEFFNYAFGNNPEKPENGTDVKHCHLVVCARESEEANVVAEIAEQAIKDKKSVLIITPDAAGNQRIASAFSARGIIADFSGGKPGTMTATGRAILNLFDSWIEDNSDKFDAIYTAAGGNLMNALVYIIDDSGVCFSPTFNVDDADSVQIWRAISQLSDAVESAGIKLSTADARAFLADTIAGVTVRGQMNDDAKVVVLGTIESRMQTADIVILTGLNDGMFPARGYENAWLPRSVSEKIGLPSPDRKVSLQSLDFMNLSCGADVYWTRSAVSGGVKTTESRFLSRVAVRGGEIDLEAGKELIKKVRAYDSVKEKPLDYSAPTVMDDWGDIHVTDLEYLIHNPYAFYVRHMLGLRVLNDYWAAPDARDFGNLVHSVIKDARDFSPKNLIKEMDKQAVLKLGADSVAFHFWHKRFLQIVPIISSTFEQLPNGYKEIPGKMVIDGHTVRARADFVWDGGVLDIKTGEAPNNSQLEQGNMPQLPLEAYMLQTGGFRIPVSIKSQTPIMMFLQLRNNDVRPIVYDLQKTQKMMNAAVAKTKEMIDVFLVGHAPYKYYMNSEQKYTAYDDLARIDD